MLYCTPACTVNTIVPVGTAQVGCVTDATVGTAGGDGALISTVDAAGVEHVLSAILLTRKVYVPGVNPGKVAVG
jgi:hypothetical protein